MSPRARSLSLLHPTDLAERGDEVARSLTRSGMHNEARIVRQLARTVAHQHAAIKHTG